MAIPIDEQWEGSICTGSVIHHDGLFYAFYATRKPDGTQHLGLATSPDGIHFAKQQPNRFMSAPEGYDPFHLRDPKVFRDQKTGVFRMLVTARLTDGRDGCIAQFTSADLRQWTLRQPLLIPGRVTDCPDLFEWNGWHYLLAEHVYWMAPSLGGPWASPSPDRLDVLYVPKTAEFGDDRRLYASWLPNGGWGGDLVFRELIQLPDGRLGTRFVEEMMPRTGDPLGLRFVAVRGEGHGDEDRVRVDASSGPTVLAASGIPSDVVLFTRVRPGRRVAAYGVGLRAPGGGEGGLRIRFSPLTQSVAIEDAGGAVLARIGNVEGLGEPFELEVVLVDDIIDVCVARRRTLIARHSAVAGDRLLLFAEHGEARFEHTRVRPIMRRTS